MLFIFHICFWFSLTVVAVVEHVVEDSHLHHSKREAELRVQS